MAFIESGKEFDKGKHRKKMKVELDNKDVSTYLLRIPAKLHHSVKIKLAKDNKKLREVLIGMLQEYINES